MKIDDYARLKSLGIMKQKDSGYFSLRLKVIAGNVTSQQLEVISKVARDYGAGNIHLTARQGIEIPFIPAADLEQVQATLRAHAVEMGVCGPRLRTVTACQGTRVCGNGMIDTTSLAETIANELYGQELPHKFKIGISGCPNNCLKSEENDLGIKGVSFVIPQPANCIHCGLCVSICPVKAISHTKEDIAVNHTACTGCGDCGRSCPTDCFTLFNGYKLYFGGMFGRTISIGVPLFFFIKDQGMVLDTIRKTINFYTSFGKKGERFAMTLERVGVEKLEQWLYQGDSVNNDSKRCDRFN